MSTAAPDPRPALVDGELAATLGRLGTRAAAVVVLTAPSARKFDRVTLRVDLEDGAVVKARHLESSEAVRELVRLRQSLDSSYSAVIAWEGRTLVEEWIEGVPLDELPADDRLLQEAARLLARLHRRLHGEPGEIATAASIETATGHLAECRDAGLLRDEEAHGLVEILHRLDPGHFEQAVTHRDFCAENIVLDHGGSLRVIDNEWIAVGSPGFELGRTRSRWPMSVAGWSAFIAAYRAVRPIDDDALRFWSIVAGAWSARLRLDVAPTAVDLPLRLLRTSLEDSC